MPCRVDFYLLPTPTLQDSLKYICRLAEKGYLSKQKTGIWVNSREEAQTMNATLWTFRDISFVPHAIYTGTENAPVLIFVEKPTDYGEILINLTPEIPIFSAHLNRIIEVIPDNSDALAISRTKYRFYQKQDCELFLHNLKTPLEGK